MDEQSPSIFTTGEFAKLCNTTKETLFHYEKIGILTPKEIKDYLLHYDTEHFLQILQEKQLQLDAQRMLAHLLI